MFLEKVAVEKRAEVTASREKQPLEKLKAMASNQEDGRSLVQALAQPGVRIIAEVKKKSPSAGDLGCRLSPTELARAYESAGASAISVLTDGPHFGGSLADLTDVKNATSLPVLRKDFIIDEYQLYEAKAAGADAVLLIAALLSPEELSALLETARAIGLDALVEVHDEEDLEKALATDARLIGINCRNLRTLEVDTKTFFEMAHRVPGNRLIVAESGISSNRELRALASAGFAGALIGSSLTKSADPAEKLKELIEA